MSGDGKKAFGAALRSVVRAGADAIVLRRARSDSHFVRLAADHLRPPTGQEAAPYADLTPYANYDEYLQSLSKNMRKGLRNRRHHLEKAGSVRFELLGVKAVRAFDANVIIVSLATHGESAGHRVVGSYLTEEDAARGAALAVLNATNRILGNKLFMR